MPLIVSDEQLKKLEAASPSDQNKPYWGRVEEASLSRLLSQTKFPFAVVTAFRRSENGKTLSYDQNRERNRQLIQIIREFGLGGTQLVGFWPEKQSDNTLGVPINQIKIQPTGNTYRVSTSRGTYSREDAIKAGLIAEVKEASFFIPTDAKTDFEKFKTVILDVIRKFNQDAAVISNGKTVWLIDQSGKLEPIGSGVSFGKLGTAYSTLRKRALPFVFEGIAQPSNWASSVLFEKLEIDYI